jgi:hypothetical protein
VVAASRERRHMVDVDAAGLFSRKLGFAIKTAAASSINNGLSE